MFKSKEDAEAVCRILERWLPDIAAEARRKVRGPNLGDGFKSWFAEVLRGARRNGGPL